MFNEIILGVIQGITEWLPVSSSGHLVIAQQIFGLNDSIAMNVMLHIGTLLVVLWIFRKDILVIVKSLWSFALTRKADSHAKFAFYIILATIPTGIIGFLLKDQIEAAFSSLLAVGIALIVTGFWLYLTKYEFRKKSLGWKSALVIGLAQGAAIFPGISRSGSTISTGLMLGIDKETAARFSFLLFIPASLGALLLQSDEFAAADYPGIAIGTITAVIVSYFVIHFLLKIIKKGRLFVFSYYCWAAGLIIILSQSI